MAKAAVKREPSKLACNWPSASCFAEGKLFALNNVMSPFFFIVTLPVKASIISIHLTRLRLSESQASSPLAIGRA
jgi:hypothetical protein